MTRTAAYREFLREGIGPDELQSFRDHARQERAWGDQRFQAMVETALGRSVRFRRPGRDAVAVKD